MKKLEQQKVFRDPIHNYIRVDDQLILDLINSTEFQRLRRIKAMGVANSVFHGAEHTRFQHSLGTYEIARKLIESFQTNYPDDWDSSQTEITLIAALLHDIGHGAYSHTFEELFDTNHEEYSQKIILDSSTQINQILVDYDQTLPQKIADVIGHRYKNKLVVSIISSQLDVDRMDYLLRDAYYSGAEYGLYDLERILRSAYPSPDGMLFNITATHTIEDYVLSRYQMYLQVYFHPVSRGLESVLNSLLNRAKFIYSKSPDEKYFPEIIANAFKGNQINLADYLQLDDAVFTTAFNLWRKHPDEILSDLAIRFLDRKPFKSISINDQDETETLTKFKQIAELNNFNPDYYIKINRAYNLAYKINIESNDNFEINLIDFDGQIVPLSKLSEPVKSISNSKSLVDTRLYMPRDLYNQTK